MGRGRTKGMCGIHETIKEISSADFKALLSGYVRKSQGRNETHKSSK